MLQHFFFNSENPSGTLKANPRDCPSKIISENLMKTFKGLQRNLCQFLKSLKEIVMGIPLDCFLPDILLEFLEFFVIFLQFFFFWNSS